MVTDPVGKLASHNYFLFLKCQLNWIRIVDSIMIIFFSAVAAADDDNELFKTSAHADAVAGAGKYFDAKLNIKVEMKIY